ncbi:M14 family metallopeptidase [Terrimonas sp. NA20]|uniref:M14 family metallopeptidase n=1 Tax=Terrimonas ginsenosidimutans TaxID=2908004 RepID=A0ABS9KLS5_9BACT|nr:M14 family metallopeptidase [Terrimonas ginsenosidimutans]MCG2613265.1 M14 family metallopeptidase [Terrimonas ginsenosidimutans]
MNKLVLIFPFLSLVAHGQLPGKFEGQGPIKGVSTETRPVLNQWKGVFSFPGANVFFRNDFTGARLNGVARVNDSTFTLLIAAENTPVNASPWYAFKVWSKTPVSITLRLTYQNARHRYTPRLSSNGRDWRSAVPDRADQQLDTSGGYSFKLEVDRDTTWIAAQELLTSRETDEWISGIVKKAGALRQTIGVSHLGRKIEVLSIGNLKSADRLLVIGRQHPPEVTGQLAQQAFIERIGEDDSLALAFRRRFLLYVVPQMNPDGVDEGFWRHNSGGVDLNRDWHAFNQPETKAVSDFLRKEITAPVKLWFALDFHSTHEDIFYIVDPQLKGLLPGLTQSWLKNFEHSIPGYVPNIKPLYSDGPTYTSFSYFFKTYGTEALVYEIGDNTSREFILRKSQLAAESLMRLLLNDLK